MWINTYSPYCLLFYREEITEIHALYPSFYLAMSHVDFKKLTSFLVTIFALSMSILMWSNVAYQFWEKTLCHIVYQMKKCLSKKWSDWFVHVARLHVTSRTWKIPIRWEICNQSLYSSRHFWSHWGRHPNILLCSENIANICTSENVLNSFFFIIMKHNPKCSPFKDIIHIE